MSKQSHIFIVDDVNDNIQVAMSILKEDGYAFSFANNGEEAIQLVTQNSSRIDLILLDIMMPGIDGFEVCRHIKNNPISKDIPIIFLTAKVDVDSIAKGFSIGAIDYIIKPFHANELLARVRTHIQLYKAQKLLQEHNISLETKLKYSQKRLLSELESNQKEMILMLTELMEYTSDETGKHIKRVAEISALLAEYHPSLSEEDVWVIYHASPMHDVGKMTVPHEILHKKGKYSAAEFDVMKTHTSNAYKLLCCSERKLMKAAAIIAHEHHEKWNGEGYPQNKKGEDIHIYGRIVALADVFDALTHKRCYKDAWPLDDVVQYIKERRGKQFDPVLVDIFIEHLDEFSDILKMS